MNKKVLLVLFIPLLASCVDTKQKNLTQSQIHAQVDSMVGMRMDEINRQAMEDLDHRIAIEVKAKADSIVDAKTGHIDTAKKPIPVNPQQPLNMPRGPIGHRHV